MWEHPPGKGATSELGDFLRLVALTQKMQCDAKTRIRSTAISREQTGKDRNGTLAPKGLRRAAVGVPGMRRRWRCRRYQEAAVRGRAIPCAFVCVNCYDADRSARRPGISAAGLPRYRGNTGRSRR